MRSISIFFVLLFWQLTATSAEVWNFKSKFDDFKIKKNAEQFVLGNQEVNPAVLADINALIEPTYGDLCPGELPPEPDATLKISSEGANEDYSFYFEKNVVKKTALSTDPAQKDKKIAKCLTVTGDGLINFPVHRSWFLSLPNTKIAHEKELRFVRNKADMFAFVKKDGSWAQTQHLRFINWEYFNQILDVLDGFPIQKQYNLSVVKDRTSFSIVADGETYNFYLIQEKIWAVQLPKTNWLSMSKSFALFGELEDSRWLDHNSSELATLVSTDYPLAERKAALTSLKDSWNESIKYAFHYVLLNKSDLDDFKYAVVLKMKQKPTNENMKIFAEVLPLTKNNDLLLLISKTLRIKNPKGPLIQENDDPELEQKIKTWQDWAKKL